MENTRAGLKITWIEKKEIVRIEIKIVPIEIKTVQIKYEKWND